MLNDRSFTKYFHDVCTCDTVGYDTQDVIKEPVVEEEEDEHPSCYTMSLEEIEDAKAAIEEEKNWQALYEALDDEAFCNKAEDTEHYSNLTLKGPCVDF